MQEKYLAKIVPVDSHPDLKEVKLSLNTETNLGRGRRTGILDKYISRNQIKIKLIKTPRGYALDFTPLAKPSCIKAANDQNIEIAAGKTEIIYPNDIFYFSRLKFPFKFQLLEDVEDEKEEEREEPNLEPAHDLVSDGTTLNEINLNAGINAEAPSEEPKKEEEKENGEVEMEIDETVKLVEKNEDEVPDVNQTLDEIDYDQRLEDQEEEKIIEYSQEITKIAESSVDIAENVEDSHDIEDNSNVVPEQVQEEIEGIEEIEESKDEAVEEMIVEEKEEKITEVIKEQEVIEEQEVVEEAKEEENEEAKEDAKEEEIVIEEEKEKKEDLDTHEKEAPLEESIDIDNSQIIEESVDVPAENVSVQTPPIPAPPLVHVYPSLSLDPSFILLVNKVTSLEAQLKLALGDFGEKLNKVVEICSPRASRKYQPDGYESDESSDAKPEPPITKKKSTPKSQAKPSPRGKVREEDNEDREKEKERIEKEKQRKERIEKEKEEKEKELEKQKEKERREKEKERKEKERIEKEKERKEKERERKEKERIEKEAKLQEKQKEKEEREEKLEKNKKKAEVKPTKKTPTPKILKRKRDGNEEEETTTPNKKKKSVGAEKWATDQDRLFKWAGDKYKENNKTFYSSVIIDDEIYSIGDTVYLTSPADVPYYIGKVLALWEDNKGKKLVQISWFFYYQDVTEILGPKLSKQNGIEPYEKKLYGSIQTDNNPVVTIEKKCDVKHLSELGDAALNPKKWASSGEDRFFFEKYFDSRTRKISYSPDMDSLEMMFEYPDKRLS